MKLAGIIAEYNPFHQGHALQLRRTKELTGADACIVVMSGNYVQRGTPAMFDKYTRAEAALRSGADLVLELPLCAATGSAEYFATGAIDLLSKAGVTELCFGSECGELSLLEEAAGILAEEPEAYQVCLREYLREGHAFPKARMMALHSIAPGLPPNIIQKPNNLLGIEYLKAIRRTGAPIQAHTIQREGSAYHETDLHPSVMASASGIRQSLLENKGCFSEEILSQLPFAEIYRPYDQKMPITEDAFSLLLLARLRGLQDEPLDCFFDVSQELSNRIWGCIDEFASFSQFADRLKTRNLTRTAVNRALLHILLDLRGYTPADAFRVLGFRADAAPVLGWLGQRPLPLVTEPGSASIAPEQLYADRLYESVHSLLHAAPYQNERRRRMLVVES